MSEAAGGNKQQIEVFKAMGIELKNSTGGLKSANEMLGEMADKFASYKDGPEKAVLAMKAFGKSGQDMIPILNKGAQGIAELRGEANRLGAVFGDDMAKASGDFNDNLKRISLSGESLKIKLAGELLPTLNTVAEAFIASKNGSSSLAEAMGGGLRNVLQTVTVLGMEIAFVFKGVGREIGGVLAQFDAMANRKSFFDFSGVQSIRKAMAEDAAAARAEQDAATRRVLGVKDGARGAGYVDPRSLGDVASIDAQTKAMRTLAPGVKDLADAAKEAASAYDSLNLSMQQRLAVMEAELTGGRKLTEGEKFDADMRTKLADATTKLSAAERARLLKTLDTVTAKSKLVEIQQREMKAAQDAYAQTVASQDEALKALRDEEDARNKIRLSVMASTQSTQEAIDLTALEAKAVFETAEDRKRLLDYYRIELDLRKKINAAAGLDQAGRDELIAIEEANAARLKGAADMAAGTAKLTNIMDSVDQTARAVWTNVWEGGVNAFQRIGQTIKSAVLDLLYQLTIKKWILQIGATVTGTSAMAQTASGGNASIGNIASLFKSSGSSWFSDFGGNLAGSVSDFGTTLLDKGFTTIGTKLEGFGLDLGSVSDSINTFGKGLGYLNAAMAASKGEWGKAAGSAIGTYFGGPIGAAIGSAIGSWVDKSFGGGTKPSTEGGYTSGGIANPGTNGRAYSAAGYYGGAIDASAKALVDDITGTYASVVKQLGGKAGALTAQAFIGYDGNGGSKGSQNALHLDAQLNGKWLYNRWTDNGGSLNAGTTADEMKAASTLSGKKILLEALKQTDLGTTLNSYLATVVTNGKALAEIDATLADVTALGQFSQAIKSLPFDSLKTITGQSAKALADLVGGFDVLNTQIASYYDNFYSDAEKQSALTQSLTNSFADLGYSLPSTRDGFRSLVDAQDLSTESGRKTYAALMGLQGAFASLIPVTKTLDSVATDAAQALQEAQAQAIAAATGVYDRSIAAERTRLQAINEVSQQAADALQGVFDLLKTSIDDLYQAVGSTAAMTAAQGQAAIDAALGTLRSTGYLPDQAALQTAIGSARAGIDGATYASQFEADKARLVLAGKLNQLKDATGQQLSSAEQALNVAKDQLASLDTTAKRMQELIDSANGIDTSVKSVEEAVADLVGLLTPKAVAKASSTTASASSASPFVIGGTAVSGTVDNPVQTVGNDAYGGISYDAYVAQSQALFAGLGGNGKSATAAIEALTEEVRALRAAQDTGNEYAANTAAALNGHQPIPLLVQTV